MKIVRGNSGIGDSLYVRAVVEYFLRDGERVTVCANHAEIFYGLDCKIEAHRRDRVTTHAVYTTRKSRTDSNQWQDVCIQAGIPADTPLCFTWQCRNPALIQELRAKANGRPLILVHGGRTPMGRKDGFGKELLPNKAAFDAVLSALGDCYTVRVGKGADAYPLPVSIDLNGATSVSELMDLGQACDAVVGQCSFAIPLAEGFDKPAIFVWAAAGFKAQHAYIRQIRPEKVLSSERSAFVLDSWSREQIIEEVHAFRLNL